MERYLRVNLLGPGPRLMKKKNLPCRDITKIEKHWSRASGGLPQRLLYACIMWCWYTGRQVVRGKTTY